MQTRTEALRRPEGLRGRAVSHFHSRALPAPGEHPSHRLDHARRGGDGLLVRDGPLGDHRGACQSARTKRKDRGEPDRGWRVNGGRGSDLVCIGRTSVDLYAEQEGVRLEDVQSFRKYVGGSAANIALNTARLGVKTAMLTRVGEEQMGRFVRRTMKDNGVDVSHVT